MIQDLDLNLTAVSMASKGEFDAELRGAIEGIGIVGEQNVGHIAANKRLDPSQYLLALAARRALALVN